MPTPRSVYDPSVEEVIADARRRAAATDQELAASNERRPYPSPEDWRDVPIYFLMADRFNNPAHEPASTAAPGNPAWDMHYASRQGGTIAGITAQLPYLAQLGVRAIWVTPLMRNCAADWMMTYHGYAAQDMLAVDERWASGKPDRDAAEAELVAMVRAAHDLGIRVILDVVINHTGMVFHYDRNGEVVGGFKDRDLLSKSLGGGALPGVVWHNGLGQARADWRDALQPGQATDADDAVYPIELRDSWLFRRRGTKHSDSLHEFPHLKYVPGDFEAMRQLAVEYEAADDDLPRRDHGRFPALALLLRIYQYWIARFDLDGFRMDTVKYVHPKFIQRFGTAISEFAYSIGKKNFFVFGEVWDENDHIADFVGRNSGDEGGFGIDAALDFPLCAAIRATCTGKLEDRKGVNALRDLFDERRQHQDELISSHGDASNYFVTFLDNHDQNQRIRHPSSPDAEVRLCLGLLYTLPGIPCLYYGTEQDLVGTHSLDGNARQPRLDSFESVREALWGKFWKTPPGAWPNGPTFQMLKALAATRAGHAPLRYGRYYFRQVSGDGVSFGLSKDKGGVIAFSRIHAGTEVLVVAYPNPFRGWKGWVEVDADSRGSSWKVVFSTLGSGGSHPAKLFSWNPNRRAVQVSLESNELLVLVPES